jgi:hypothetical protein
MIIDNGQLIIDNCRNGLLEIDNGQWTMDNSMSLSWSRSRGFVDTAIDIPPLARMADFATGSKANNP